MDIDHLMRNQNPSDKSLRGMLLENVDPFSKDPNVKMLNNWLTNRVVEFWNEVVTPLREQGKFDYNKIKLYFDIYRQGIAIKEANKTPFKYVEVTDDQIKELVNELKGKTMAEYLDLGMYYIHKAHLLLSLWKRDYNAQYRLRIMYYSNNPVDWILDINMDRAMEEYEGIPGLDQVMRNCELFIKKRV